MPVAVVLDGPREFDLIRSLLRSIRVSLGAVLVVVSLIAVWPAIAVTLLLLSWIFDGTDEEQADWWPWFTDRVWITWLAVAGGAVAAYVVGMRLVRGRRRTVLFLRRFGHTEATEVITKAVRKIGGYWRVITLDDARVEPLGYSADAARGLKFLGRAFGRSVSVGSRILRVLRAVVVVVVLIYAFLVWRGYREHGELDVDIERIFAVMQVVLLVGAGFMALLFAYIALIPLVVGAKSLRDGIETAEQGKEIKVSDKAVLPTLAGEVEERTRKVISPRLIVLEVATPIWHDTVATFASRANVALVDVSTVSENVLWEIEHLQAHEASRCVYVGQYDRLGALYEIPEHGTLAERVQQRLTGVSVLAYETTPKGVRRFTRALRATLDATAAGEAR